MGESTPTEVEPETPLIEVGVLNVDKSISFKKTAVKSELAAVGICRCFGYQHFSRNGFKLRLLLATGRFLANFYRDKLRMSLTVDFKNKFITNLAFLDLSDHIIRGFNLTIPHFD